MLSIKNIHKQLLNNLGTTIDGKVILDYGCGHGGMIKLLLEEYSPKNIIAVDSNEQVVNSIISEFRAKVDQNKLEVKHISNPEQLANYSFDIIICHNVIECIEKKEQFINGLYKILNKNGVLLVSHHDFDSAIYNSSYVTLTRNLIHYFADSGEAWQTICDGQIGRKLPGLFKKSGIKDYDYKVIRLVETDFQKEDYGYLMSKMILEASKNNFSKKDLSNWLKDLKDKAKEQEFLFAIDLVLAIAYKK